MQTYKVSFPKAKEFVDAISPLTYMLKDAKDEVKAAFARVIMRRGYPDSMSVSSSMMEFLSLDVFGKWSEHITIFENPFLKGTKKGVLTWTLPAEVGIVMPDIVSSNPMLILEFTRTDEKEWFWNKLTPESLPAIAPVWVGGLAERKGFRGSNGFLSATYK